MVSHTPWCVSRSVSLSGGVTTQRPLSSLRCNRRGRARRACGVSAGAMRCEVQNGDGEQYHSLLHSGLVRGGCEQGLCRTRGGAGVTGCGAVLALHHGHGVCATHNEHTCSQCRRGTRPDARMHDRQLRSARAQWSVSPGMQRQGCAGCACVTRELAAQSTWTLGRLRCGVTCRSCAAGCSASSGAVGWRRQ